VFVESLVVEIRWVNVFFVGGKNVRLRQGLEHDETNQLPRIQNYIIVK